MPKINLDGYIKINRDVFGGETIKFMDEGNFKKSQFKNPDGSDKFNLEFKVELPDGEVKLLTVNRTSQKTLIAKWSKDTTTWVGKKAKVVEGMTPQGKKCVFLESVE